MYEYHKYSILYVLLCLVSSNRRISLKYAHWNYLLTFFQLSCAAVGNIFSSEPQLLLSAAAAAPSAGAAAVK